MNNGPDGGLGGADRDAGAVAGSVDAGSACGDCDTGVGRPGGVDLPVVTPDIFIDGQPIVLVKKPYTDAARVRRKQVTLVADDIAFDGSGTFTFTGNAIRFFTQAADGREVSSGDSWAGLELGMGVRLYAEGARPSASMRDVELVLTLTPGSKRVNPPARERMTSVEVTLDIHKSRTAAATDPVVLTVAQKTSNPGRIVHVQDTSYHHGRALLIIRKALPHDFTGDLVLTAEGAAVRFFDTPHEIAAGQAVLPTPYTIGNGAVATPAGKRLWAEAANVSGAVGDTGFRLGVSGVHTDGDRVKMTSVQFSNLRATVSSTPPNQQRMANGPVPNHTPFGGGSAAANYDESFVANAPLVMIEGALPMGTTVALSVEIRPRVPVRWSLQRNRAAGTGDHAQVILLSPNPEPTVTPPSPADSLTATLRLNAVGSFHIRPFVDIDGAGRFEYNDAAGNRIEREPFIIMNLVLVRAQGYRNTSVQQTPNASATPATGAAPITAATGVVVRSGAWTGATAAVHNVARITLIGGGNNGRLGLNKVYAGWVNNLNVGVTARGYLDASAPHPVAPVAHVEQMIFVQNSPTVLAPAYQQGVFRAAGSVAPVGVPSSTAAPVPLPLPLLDVSPFANPGTGGNTCVGTEGAPGPPVAILKTPLPGGGHALAYGEDWTVEMFDSPANSAPPAPTMFAGSLTELRYERDFRCDLCVWTNTAAGVTPGATNDAACRLYASVQENRWTIRYRITFQPPLAPGAPAPPAGTPAPGTRTGGSGPRPTIGITLDANPTRLARPVQGSGLEVRAPILLARIAFDART
jgi:hypothetical protein